MHKSTVPDALLNVIAQHSQGEFNCVSFAVDKQAAEGIRTEHPAAVPSDAKMLMDLCRPRIACAKEDFDQTARIRVLFDQNEPFIRHLKTSWQTGRKVLSRARQDGWPLQVREVEPASSNDHPGLQIADLLSWAVRSRYEYGDKLIDSKTPKILLTFMWRLQGGFLDSEAIRTLYVDGQSLTLNHNYGFV